MRVSTRILVGCLALLGLGLTAQPADAAFKISLSQDGGAFVEVASGADFGAIVFSGTFGDFNVVLNGASSTNGANLSSLLGSTNSITNNDSDSSHTLQVMISQTDYTLPPTSILAVESGMGGSINTGTLGLTGVFQAYADKANALYGTSDFTNGPQNANQTGSTFDTGSANGVFSRVGNYSVTSISTLLLSGGGQVNYSNHVNLTPVPAPAGLVLLATAIPVLGLRRVLRRKLATA